MSKSPRLLDIKKKNFGFINKPDVTSAFNFTFLIQNSSRKSEG